MAKRLAKASKSTASLPADYAPLLADIKARVQSARIKAGVAANRELLALYETKLMDALVSLKKTAAPIKLPKITEKGS